ncbi:MAG: hypothetical protein EOS73_18255 [Mesorhizobium sp.]|nr:MAG: hypothetical protein EOS27_30265 [Mesorhizobium sp.]RWD06213.1 MAG: hypothetical protein EOS73_18255 [Mesorhizobium sp.]
MPSQGLGCFEARFHEHPDVEIHFDDDTRDGIELVLPALVEPFDVPKADIEILILAVVGIDDPLHTAVVLDNRATEGAEEPGQFIRAGEKLKKPRRICVAGLRLQFQSSGNRRELDAFVRLVFFRRMVKRHELPTVIHDRRARTARLGVRLVLDDLGVLEHHRVVADRDFLEASVGVLDDIQLVFVSYHKGLPQKRNAAEGRAGLAFEGDKRDIETALAVGGDDRAGPEKEIGTQAES